LSDSFELFYSLFKLNLLKDKPNFWWPNAGEFEVVVGAILTQQTKWQKVEKSLNNLREKNLLSLEKLANIDEKELALIIKPSGFYNTKSKWIKQICLNIKNKFDNFQNFQNSVEREWLLSQKGIGEESGDSILCYGCFRDEMVVDTYTNRILKAFGYEFEKYQDIKEWLIEGIILNRKKVDNLFDKKPTLNTIYSYFHGAIVEYAKLYSRGKNISIDKLKEE